MSVMERVAKNSASPDTLNQRWTRLRANLREALVMRLGYKEIARIASVPSKDRSQEELSVTLQAILNEGNFESMSPEERSRLMREIIDDVIGLGPLETFMNDDSVTEVMVNGTGSLFYERDGCLLPAQRVFDNDEQIRYVIDRIIAPLGRRIDEQSPIVNARLKNGYRVNAVIPPIAIDGPALTIRKFSHKVWTLEALAAKGALPPWYAWLLGIAVKCRQDIAVAGGTGSGKTTVLNALSCEIDAGERIVTIEDSAELKFQSHPHVVRLEARDASIEGSGAVTIRDLVINALRMRPDRIVVGEVRGGEAIDMLQAMNTGHDGSLTTLHAGTPEEVILRLVLMARFGIDLPASLIEAQIATALDLIVMTMRLPGGKRVIGELCACERSPQGTTELKTLVSFDDMTQRWELTEAEPVFLTQAIKMGITTCEEARAWLLSAQV